MKNNLKKVAAGVMVFTLLAVGGVAINSYLSCNSTKSVVAYIPNEPPI
jgi:hypothetical protein